MQLRHFKMKIIMNNLKFRIPQITTTKRPVTKPPKKQPTTTVQQQYDEVTDSIEEEEEEEEVGEETGEEESTPYFESGRVRKYFNSNSSSCSFHLSLFLLTKLLMHFIQLTNQQIRMRCSTTCEIRSNCWRQGCNIW